MNAKRVRAKRLFGKFLLILAGFLFGSMVAEIALRVAGYSYPEFYQLDDVRGVSMRPGAEGWYRTEGESYVRINSDGLRDAEHLVAKPEETFRIAILGDSYCQAFQVSAEEAFWSVMGADLKDCEALNGKKVEVINFGVSGYGTAQELLTLREKVWQYSPDLVLLAVTTNNDITDNSRVLKKTDDFPYFVYRDSQLTLDDSFRNSRTFRARRSALGRIGSWFRTHSRVVAAVIQGHRGFKLLLASWRAKPARGANTDSGGDTASKNSKTPDKADLFARSEELGADNLVYLEPDNAVWNDAWRVTEGLIVQMSKEVTAHGVKFVVVTLSNGPQVLPDPAVRENFKKNFGVTDLFYPDLRIKSLGAREGILVMTLAPELQEFAEGNHVFLHGFEENLGNGHWNATGHRVAGQLLAKKICGGNLLK